GEQLNSIGMIMKYVEMNLMNKNLKLEEIVDLVIEEISKKGLISIDKIKGGNGSLALPRKQEIMATYNRYRKLQLR
ncbi:MAG: ABC-ATPase domain-containing protein, partial [Clostridium sp.]